VLLERDAGSQYLPPNMPSQAKDAGSVAVSVASAALGRAYAESEFVLQQPAALQKAFASLAMVNNDTRLFVIQPYTSDAGSEVRYGAADRVDGGLVWQKPPAHPRSFALAASQQNGQTLVSAAFAYVLEARVPLAAGKVFRLYLEAEQAVFRATFNMDFSEISSGELRGVLTREQLEHRPLDLASCTAACAAKNLSVCSQSSELQLAVAFDCNGQQPDVDTDGDGSLDGYLLLLSFESRAVAPPTE
jgi:hypothetical protein